MDENNKNCSIHQNLNWLIVNEHSLKLSNIEDIVSKSASL